MITRASPVISPAGGRGFGVSSRATLRLSRPSRIAVSGWVPTSLSAWTLSWPDRARRACDWACSVILERQHAGSERKDQQDREPCHERSQAAVRPSGSLQLPGGQRSTGLEELPFSWGELPAVLEAHVSKAASRPPRSR